MVLACNRSARKGSLAHVSEELPHRGRGEAGEVGRDQCLVVEPPVDAIHEVPPILQDLLTPALAAAILEPGIRGPSDADRVGRVGEGSAGAVSRASGEAVGQFSQKRLL